MAARRAFRPTVVENTLEARIALNGSNLTNPWVYSTPINHTPNPKGALTSSLNLTGTQTNSVGSTPIAGGGSVRGGAGLTFSPLVGSNLTNPWVYSTPINHTPNPKGALTS
jgi:hypothetical protein